MRANLLLLLLLATTAQVAYIMVSIILVIVSGLMVRPSLSFEMLYIFLNGKPVVTDVFLPARLRGDAGLASLHVPCARCGTGRPRTSSSVDVSVTHQLYAADRAARSPPSNRRTCSCSSWSPPQAGLVLGLLSLDK